MTIIIVICAEIVNMVIRLAAQGGKRNPRMLSVGYTAAVGRAGVAPSRQADTAHPRTGARCWCRTGVRRWCRTGVSCNN